MNRETREWDVRVGALPRLDGILGERTGYYYRLTLEQSQALVDHLKRTYRVRRRVLVVADAEYLREDGIRGAFVYPGDCARGDFDAGRKPVIVLYPRSHIKTVVHEFYHYLEWATDGVYDSSDHRALAWAFAERWWHAARRELNEWEEQS